MLQNKTIAVIVPCFNEQDQITKVLGTMPDFVDLIVVINDKSTDATSERVREFIKRDNRPSARIEKRARTYSDGLYDHGILSAGIGWQVPRMPGLGEGDWPGFFANLYRAGYDGPIIIEHEDRDFEDTDEKVKRGFAVARDVLRPFVK